MDIRKGNDVNVYFELSKIGVPSAESIKGIRCFFVKDVRSESGDVPVPPSLNPSSYVIHDHMHPGYNVHMPYRSITLHVHREFCVPDNCPPGWHGQTVFVVTDYKIVNIEKDGETVPYLRVVFGGDNQRNGRYNVVLEIVYIGIDDQGGSDVKCTYDYGHQFDLTDQITALSGRIDIWLTDQKNISTKVEELEKDLALEISRSTTLDEHMENAILSIHGSIDDLHDEVEDVEDAVSVIEEKIPSTASSNNQLADKNFVNSSISTSTATFRGTVYTVDALENITEADENDYAFVVQRKERSTVIWNWLSNNPEGIKDITIEGIGATGTIPSTDADFTINVKGATEETNVRVVYTTDSDNNPGVGLSEGTQLLVPVRTVGDAILVRGRDRASYIPITIDGVRKYGSNVVAHTVTLEDVERGYAVIEAVEDCVLRAIMYIIYSNDAFHRYKYTNDGWEYEYTLNNSSFTADQWAAINSGITSELVSKFGTTATTTSDGLMSSLDKIKLDNLGTITDGSEIVQSAGENTTFVGAVSRLVSSLFYAMCPAGKFKGLYNIDNDYQVGEYVVNPDDMKLYVFTYVHYHGEGLSPNVNCEEVHLS